LWRKLLLRTREDADRLIDEIIDSANDNDDENE
jgi:hypothetical protein